MSSNSKYDSIRPHEGKEIKEAINRLLASNDFLDLFCKITQTSREEIKNRLNQVSDRDDFQKLVFGYFAQRFIELTTQGVSFSDIESIDADKSYLFLTNHRDIILDSAILNLKLRETGKFYTQPAIGSNLLITDWIKDLVKLNSCFTVERDVSVREMMTSSILRSEYIRDVISEGKNSIWIAQREGRTKDGYDKTQPSLLKMLKLGDSYSFVEAFDCLNIVVAAISYEWEPCDIYKTQELYLKATDEYTKTQADDMNSMVYGMTCEKGRINYHFSPITRSELEEIDTLANNGVKIDALTELIDEKIYSNFKLWPNNYIAYDLLNSTKKFIDKYTDEEKNNFISIMTSKIGRIEGNVSMLNTIFLNIYANPVKNKFKL